VERFAAERDYMTVLCDTADDPELEARALRFLGERQADGLIVCPVSSSPDIFNELAGKGTPLVFVDRYFPDLDFSAVTSDDHAAGRQVANLFLEKGHRRVGCLVGDPGSSSSRQRSVGFRAALEKAGIEIDESINCGESFSISDGYRSARKILQSSPRPTGFFSFANVNTLGALQALGEAGLKIPGDISLISFDDQPYATVLATPLSSVVQNTDKLAREALRLIFDQIDHPENATSERVVIPTEFIDRNSVSLITQ